mmetsp:Transcript_21286/g.43775  ORF Transcript_21286/g.43775 Transcript_21286/m.43775 type:complete len:259 (+) Transcript_21286:212-988(+)
MGRGKMQSSPTSQSLNGHKIGMEKFASEEFLPKKRASFKIESASEEFRVSKRSAGTSFKNKESDKPGSFFVSKGSSDHKWQRAKMVIGALEVKSDPFLQPKEDMKPLYKTNDEGATKTKFEDALQAWVDLKLRKSFTKACADLPDSVSCCGLVQSDNASMIKQYVTLLNDGWVKHANKKMRSRGFKIDAFLSDYNSSGNTAMSILLIRFFELSTYKFRQASEEGSLDLNDMLLDNRGPIDASSHYSASHNSSEDDINR